MPIDPQAPAARLHRRIAVTFAIVFVVALVNLVVSSSRGFWALVAVVAAVGALYFARAFSAFPGKNR